jgi:cyclic pyranopterin phosphate synthase
MRLAASEPLPYMTGSPDRLTTPSRKTSDLIPLCHPLPLDFIDIQIDLIDGSVAVITCECHVVHKTGVEMEALTGASIAALTIYDMTKALSHRIRIEDTVLLSKTGGKRDVSTTEEGESS